MRHSDLNNNKNLVYQNLWNAVSDQREIYSFKWIYSKKEGWKSMIEVSILGNYKIKSKLNPKYMEGKIKLKQKSMT